MTRYTNFGRKRTYLDAGFNYRDDHADNDNAHGGEQAASATPHASTSTQPQPPSPVNETAPEGSAETIDGSAQPKKSKRKRSKKGKGKQAAEDGAETAGAGERREGGADEGEGGADGADAASEKRKKKAAKTEKVMKAKAKLKEKMKARRTKGQSLSRGPARFSCFYRRPMSVQMQQSVPRHPNEGA